MDLGISRADRLRGFRAEGLRFAVLQLAVCMCIGLGFWKSWDVWWKGRGIHEEYLEAADGFWCLVSQWSEYVAASSLGIRGGFCLIRFFRLKVAYGFWDAFA